MDLGLKGKTAVVSGSTAGIGFAMAATLAGEGAKVVVNGRTEARVSAALAQIRQRVKNADVRGVDADLGTSAGVEMLVKQVPDADIPVNDLGIFEIKPFAETSDADWLRLFEVNVLRRSTCAPLPAFDAREAPGSHHFHFERMAKEQGLTPIEIEKQVFARVRPSSLLRRFETPEEVAAVVAFVASRDAVTINGAAVRAEGGAVRSIF